MDWYNFRRDLCSNDLLHNPIVLGGPGHIVAIDETLMAEGSLGYPGSTRRGAVVFRRHNLATGDFFMTLVMNCAEATLLPVIQRNVAPGTRVWSDVWAAYRNLNGYVHQMVNHSRHFVNPITGGSHELH